MTLEWPEEDRKIEGKTRVKLEDEYGLKLDAPPPIIGGAGDRTAALTATRDGPQLGKALQALRLA